MRRCPGCECARAWRLADGRFKCRRCGRRYRGVEAGSVWNFFRLSGATKDRLLDYFILGVPSYRLRFHDLASTPTRERFFRIVRAVMAHEECLRRPFEGLGGCGSSGRGAEGVVAFGILQHDGVVRLSPVGSGGGEEDVVELIRSRPGGLCYSDDSRAYASLAVHGDYVVVGKARGRSGGDGLEGVEGFWSYARRWLCGYRGVPRKMFHLYLGEVSYRFNHRHEALFPLLRERIRRLTMAEIDAVMARDSVRGEGYA